MPKKKPDRVTRLAAIGAVFGALFGGLIGAWVGPPLAIFRIGFFGLPDPLIGASIFGFAGAVLAWLAISEGMARRD